MKALRDAATLGILLLLAVSVRFDLGDATPEVQAAGPAVEARIERPASAEPAARPARVQPAPRPRKSSCPSADRRNEARETAVVEICVGPDSLC